MSLKRPLIFLGLFAALALLYYFYEYKGGKEREAQEALEKKAVQFSADSLDRFIVIARRDSAPGADTTVLEHSTAGWKITAPFPVAADSEAVARLLSNAAGAALDRVVEDSAADLSIFGLDTPKLVLEVFPSGLKESRRLSIGNKSPGDSYIYAANAVAPHKVILLNSWVLSDLNKTVKDLRDKKLLHADRNRIGRLVSAGAEPGVTLRLEKQDEQWRLTAPLAVPAESDSVKNLLEKITGAEAKGFIDTLAVGGLKAYGLDPPQFTLTLVEQGSAALYELQFGGTDSAGNYYARRKEMDGLFLAGADLVELLKRDPSALRDMALVSQPKDKINRLTLVLPLERITAVKDSGDTWRLSEPKAARADGSKIDGLLWDLKDLKAKSFLQSPYAQVENYFKQPFLEVIFRADSTENRLTFAHGADRPADSLVYVKVSQSPDVAVVDSSTAWRLVQTFDELCYRRIIEFDTGKITRVRLEFPGRTLELEKKGEDWQISGPEKVKAQGWKVQNLLWDLSELKFTQVISENGADSTAYGFAAPVLKAAFWAGDSLAAGLTFADSVAGKDERCLRASGDPKIYAVEGSVFRGIPDTVEKFKPEDK